jgi:hypothetical protein
MKPTERKNGIAASREVARMRRTEKFTLVVWAVVVGLIGIVAFFSSDREAFFLGFPIFVLVTLLPILVFLRHKCPFCGVALTRNSEGTTGTLFLPKCLKCGVPFDVSPKKKSAD